MYSIILVQCLSVNTIVCLHMHFSTTMDSCQTKYYTLAKCIVVSKGICRHTIVLSVRQWTTTIVYIISNGEQILVVYNHLYQKVISGSQVLDYSTVCL